MVIYSWLCHEYRWFEYTRCFYVQLRWWEIPFGCISSYMYLYYATGFYMHIIILWSMWFRKLDVLLRFPVLPCYRIHWFCMCLFWITAEPSAALPEDPRCKMASCFQQVSTGFNRFQSSKTDQDLEVTSVPWRGSRHLVDDAPGIPSKALRGSAPANGRIWRGKLVGFRCLQCLQLSSGILGCCLHVRPRVR